MPSLIHPFACVVSPILFPNSTPARPPNRTPKLAASVPSKEILILLVQANMLPSQYPTNPPIAAPCGALPVMMALPAMVRFLIIPELPSALNSP